MGTINLLDETITDAHWIISDGGFGGKTVLYGINRSAEKKIPIAQISENHKTWDAFCRLDRCYIFLPRNLPNKDFAKEEVYHHLRMYHSTTFHNIYVNYPSIKPEEENE